MIHRYGYIPPGGWKPTKKLWENTVYLGVELEIEYGGDRREHSDKIKKRSTYHSFDSSLDHGYEITTQPMTIQKHRDFGWYDFLRKIDKSGATSYRSGNCGLHVHISRSALCDLDVRKILIFFTKCEEKYFWPITKRYNTHYAQRINCSPSILYGRIGEQNSRYVSVNVCDHTVEIRAFRGTLKHSRFLACLQFCDALVGFAKWNGTGFFYRANALEMWTQFLHWADGTNRYCHLLKFLKK